MKSNLITFESSVVKMHSLLKILFIGSITFLSNQTYAFIKLYLLTDNKGNTALILGDHHYDDSLTEKNKEHIDLLISKALESGNGFIPCIVELDKPFEPAFRGETLPAGYEMASTMAHLATYVSKGAACEKIKFITYDPRNFDSALLVPTMRWLAQLLPNARANKLVFSQKKWQEEIKLNFLHREEARNYTVKSYFTQLDENVLYIKSLAEKYAAHSGYAKLFIELYNNFLQATESAKKYFASCASDRPMVLAVLDTFDNYLEPAKFLYKYEEFNTTLLEAVDYLYFDICCLDKMLSCMQTSNKCLLIVGSAHASAISNQLIKLGYKSILEEVNEAQIDGTSSLHSAELTTFEVALVLFFSNGPIPAQLLPSLEQAQKAAAASFEQRVANAIEKYSRAGLISTSVKQTKPQTVVSDFKLLKVEENPTSITSIGDLQCYNSSCQKKSTSTCTRCKRARYCGRDCQLADWQKHKLDCKQQK